MALGCFVVAASFASAPAARAFDEPFRVIDGGKWDLSRGPIEFNLEPTGSEDISGNADLDAVRNAFRAWTCVPGTALRFTEGEEGQKKLSDSDGHNNIFWDETNEFGLGPATLGVTIGDAVPGGTRAQADIIFNGFDSAWSVDDRPSQVDVGSIALHEIGHFLGLDHPCDHTPAGEEEPDTCHGPNDSVMTPAWSGGLERAPKPDDEAGVLALYPADDPKQTCDGPFLLGERCACDEECIDGLVCVPGTNGQDVCAKTCAADQSDCGNGFACVLDTPEGDEPAPGVCVKSDDGEHPAGSVCVSRGECGDGQDCALVKAVGRSVCRTDCGDDGDCAPGERCGDGSCILAASSTACPAKDPPADGCECGAAAHGGSTSAPWAALLALGAVAANVMGPRKRRRGPRA
jgi:hypothetical protein